MGRQIIKQPNGKYCIFSSVVDNVILYDMTAEEIIEEWTKEAREDIERKVKDIVSKIDKNEKPYFQFTKNYDEMIEDIKEIHGKKEGNKIKKLIESSSNDNVE
jgi:hypothetical protein